MIDEIVIPMIEIVFVLFIMMEIRDWLRPKTKNK